MEERIAWPWQALRAWIGLLPKDSGDDRAIAMLALMARIWEQLRGADADDRAAERREGADLGDAARGSPAAKASLRRCVSDESAAEFDVPTASALLNAEALYGSLSPVIVLRLATRHRHLAVILAMAMPLHLAPRFLRSRKNFSGPIVSALGLLAGCRRAQRLAATTLHDLLSTVSSRSRPGLSARTGEDDANSRAEGPPQRVLDDTVEFASQFSTGLADLHLSLSGKSQGYRVVSDVGAKCFGEAASARHPSWGCRGQPRFRSRSRPTGASSATALSSTLADKCPTIHQDLAAESPQEVR